MRRSAAGGSEWRCDRDGDVMRYAGARWHLDLPLPSLPGAHQIENAGAALACLEQLAGFALPPAALAAGLRHIDWPARLQRLRHGPLVDLLPAGWELWLDGGHNPAAGTVLADAANGWRDRPLDLVVGMLNTKDSAGFLRPLAAYARGLDAVTIPGEENPLPAAAIAAAGRSVGIAAQEGEFGRSRAARYHRPARAGAGADLRLAAPRRRGPRGQRVTTEEGMRAIALAAFVLAAAAAAGAAQAESLCPYDWCRHVEALVGRLLDKKPTGHDIIAPPANIDPKMALVPPRPGGTMRMIVPPAQPRQN